MQLKLNKHDIIFTLLLLIISVTIIIISLNNESIKGNNEARVYLHNKHVYTFNLNNNDQSFYEIEATNGLVIIESKDGKIRVIEENSNNNVCSNQGWTNSTLTPIICLPNDLFIVIETGEEKEVDVIVE